MRVAIKGPQSIHGEVKAPGSKAYTHRALVASLLTHGETRILDPLDCDDTKRTLDGIKALGASVTVGKDGIVSHGPERLKSAPQIINCGESGATFRFLAATASVSPVKSTLRVEGGLATRPMRPLLEALNSLGAMVSENKDGQELELQVQGPLKGGDAALPGNVSSQFVSGLLLAAPLAQSDVAINLDSRLESRPYVDMTVDVLRKHGVEVESNEKQFVVPAPQDYKSTSHHVPGDFSSSAFLMATAAIAGDEIAISGLTRQSLEPDAAILDLAPIMGLELHAKGQTIVVNRSELQGFRFDASDNPDLVPALEVLACNADGSSEITGVKRLRYKETDRLSSVPAELTKMGVRFFAEEDRITIEPTGRLIGAVLDSHHDHRVAMACASAAFGARGISIVENAQAVSKSYPDFFRDLASLGGVIHVE